MKGMKREDIIKKLIAEATTPEQANRVITDVMDITDVGAKLDYLKSELGIIVGACRPMTGQTDEKVLADNYRAALVALTTER
jgi:hypothetical protein